MASNIVNTQKMNSGFDVIFTNPKRDDKGNLSVGILDSITKKPFYIETPELSPSFGLSVYDPTKTNADPKKYVYSIPLSTEFVDGEDNIDTDPARQSRIDQQKIFMNTLKNIDEKLVSFGIKNSQFIFKKHYQDTEAGREIFREHVYSGAIRHNVVRDEKTGNITKVYPDKINLKIPANDTENTGPTDRIQFYKNSEDALEIRDWDHLSSLIPARKPIMAILQPRIFATPQKFGITFRIVQVKLCEFERVGRPQNYSFSVKPQGVAIENEKTEEKAEEKAEPKKEKKNDTHTEDSDAENVDVDEVKE